MKSLIIKSEEENYVINGDLDKARMIVLQALQAGKFTSIDNNRAENQITANYKKFSVWGSIKLTLVEEEDKVTINAVATAKTDNIQALFSSPTQKIFNKFKGNIKIDRNLIPAYIAIVSALFAIIGCLMPWTQFGFLQMRGIEGDGVILLVAAVIAGAIAVFNLSKRENRNAWIFIIAGLVGGVIFYVDISALNERVNTTINVANFIGTGVYIALLGSVGLIIAGLVGLFKRNIEEIQTNTFKN